MAIWTPPAILRPILRSGGEIALGLAYSLGKSAAYIERLFVHRFRLSDPFARQELEQFSAMGAQFGHHLAGLSADDLIPLEVFPVNPELFGGGKPGSRIITVSDVSGNQGETWVQKRVEWPDQPTFSELVVSLAELLEDLLEKYPGQFGALVRKDRPEPQFRHHFAERQF